MSPVQQELSEMSTRYDMIGIRLNERQRELENIRDELRKIGEAMRNVVQAIEKAERSLPRDTVPTTKEEADKHNKLVKSIRDDMIEKQWESLLFWRWMLS